LIFSKSAFSLFQIQDSHKKTSLQGLKEEEEKEEQETAASTNRGNAARGGILTTATRFRGIHSRGPGNNCLAILNSVLHRPTIN